MIISALEEALNLKQQELTESEALREEVGKETLVKASLHKEISHLSTMVEAMKELKSLIGQATSQETESVVYSRYGEFDKKYRKDIVKYLRSYGYKVKIKYLDSCLKPFPCFCKNNKQSLIISNFK